MRRRLIAYDVLSAMTICAVVGIGIWRAPNVFLRTGEALRDLIYSVAYLLGFRVDPTVSSLSVGTLESFPKVWSEFSGQLSETASRLVSGENFLDYLAFLAQGSRALIYILTFAVLGTVVFFIAVKVSLKRYNRDWNRQSRPLRIFLKIYESCFLPVRNFIRGFIHHFWERSPYRITVIVLAAFFLNLFTMPLEFLAWYLGFIVDFDLIGIGVQVIKLSWDLLLLVRTLPWWAWILVVLKGLDLWRREMGFRRLEAHEERFRKFASERAIMTIIVAPMRTGKTTLLAALQRTFVKIFRTEAKRGMREIDLKFPNLPWIVLEKTLQRAYRSHEVYTLSTVRKWADHICALHRQYQNDPVKVRQICKRLEKKYGVPFRSSTETACFHHRSLKGKHRKIPLPGTRKQTRRSILFGYDVSLWKPTYNGGLGEESVYDAIRDYAQLYFIYLTPVLHVGNLPVRMDDDLEDNGNEIRWDDDFCRKDPSPLNKSRLSHILDYDTMRLGRRVDPGGKYRNALEFGVVGMTELGKERGNQYDQKGLQASAPESNILNDLFNQDIKMRGHSANIYYFPFIRFIGDEQRASSINADLLQTGDRITILEHSKTKIVMPLFAIGEMLEVFAEEKLGKIFDEKVYNRGDQTLCLWILHNMIQKKIFDHYQRIRNIYGVFKLNLAITSGQDELFSSVKTTVVLSTRKCYANVFPSDVYQDLYDKKASRSETGISDMPCFADIHPEDGELDMMHSHAYTQWKMQFVEEQLIERLRAAEEKSAKAPGKTAKTDKRETKNDPENPQDP